MATTAAQTATAPPADPFRYGWRYIAHPLPDGDVRYEQVPLTLEDVLHPQEGDFIVQNERHHRRCTYLYDVARAQLADDPTAAVLSDVRIAWDVTPPKAHGPDLAVIFGVREHRPWGTFDVAIEGARPSLIIEVTSPETAHLDRGVKRDEYAEVGVPLYIIVDTVIEQGASRLRLLGYTLTPAGYQPLTPDERGRLWLPPLRAWLGIADNEIVCYDEAGNPLGDYAAVSASLRAETAARLAAEEQVAREAAARADAEQRAKDAEARLRELEALLRQRDMEQ
jgi:colicin import membrane protein